MKIRKSQKEDQKHTDLLKKYNICVEKSSEMKNEYEKLKQMHLKVQTENKELKDRLEKIHKNIQHINKGKSYRFTKINIELLSDETFFTFKTLLESLKIDSNDFLSVISKLANRGSKKPITVLKGVEMNIFIKWTYLLFHFGLQSKQIAYLTGNTISPSVLARYLKVAYGDSIKQKPIATYNVSLNDKQRKGIVGKLQFTDEIPIGELLSQKMFCCVFDKTTRIELNEAIKMEKVVSRKK